MKLVNRTLKVTYEEFQELQDWVEKEDIPLYEVIENKYGIKESEWSVIDFISESDIPHKVVLETDFPMLRANKENIPEY